MHCRSRNLANGTKLVKFSLNMLRVCSLCYYLLYLDHFTHFFPTEIYIEKVTTMACSFVNRSMKRIRVVSPPTISSPSRFAPKTFSPWSSGSGTPRPKTISARDSSAQIDFLLGLLGPVIKILYLWLQWKTKCISSVF